MSTYSSSTSKGSVPGRIGIRNAGTPTRSTNRLVFSVAEEK
ncbi:hypothetical protein HMPREF0573_10605 [Mobiluncus curtisii ATCC 43063]|uniref:Uncharacterized protein n=1 Tax=Mobiluncus curtisii (strain ATCC 43063 / DSM 2711 / V125) TaxID=548479 RepID=D6ZJM5_MOBCV|nr:hypothetical protein HMPREF0573_10605 [Mobiluncus curtisii ATCC 43063]